jgi:hypothetical protein
LDFAEDIQMRLLVPEFREDQELSSFLTPVWFVAVCKQVSQPGILLIEAI